MIKNRGSPTLSAGSTISPVTNISKVSTEISKISTRKSAHAKRASRTRNPRGRWVGRGVAVECYTTTNPTTTTRPHDILPSLSPSTRAHTSSLSLIGGTCAPCLSAFLLSYFLTFLLSYFLHVHTSSLSFIGGTCAEGVNSGHFTLCTLCLAVCAPRRVLFTGTHSSPLESSELPSSSL
jgi:hypothetical protein